MANRRYRESARDKDPHRVREAKKYANPIPSREYIMEQLARFGAPLGRDKLAAMLDLQEEEELEALRRRLNAMERDGQLIRNRRDGFCLVNKKDLIAGRVIGHRDGFGFLKPDNGGDDLFLTPRQMRPLLHGDRAVVRVVGVDQRGRREGALVEVLEHVNSEIVGRIYIEGGLGFVVPDDKRINQDLVVRESDLNGASHGQIVVAEILEQPSKRSQPIGRVVEVLGEHMAPGMETDVAIRAHGLPLAWPDEVKAEIFGLDEAIDKREIAGRTDLRKLPLVTIDGADARDFDDAVYCEATAKGWKLLVAIADVSSYVKPHSALDQEARLRGTSVYFPDRVIPMLPEVLSNGLCSLNPEVDRLCMVCELYISADGKITRSKFFAGAMRSKARLTYDQVAAMLLDGDTELCKKYADLLPHLHQLYALYQVLHASRSVRGAIDFDTTETRILFNEDSKVERIVPVQRNDAHRLIEECMLAANVAAARFLLRKKLPALYRVHEGPPEQKLIDLRDFLAELGLRLSGGDKPSAKDYADLLDAVQGRPDSHLLQTVLLRSMSQALYSAENIGHFGLAFPAYTHFTSPIRRYPDLVVHRAIHHLITGGGEDDFLYSRSELHVLGEHCSTTERRADEATRDAEAWLKCEYMTDKIGESFDGIITSVTSFGLFVELAEIYVEGLVHITSLDHDYFHFDPVGHRLSGERSGRVYRLGDPIRIKVAAVNLDDKKIDFTLDETRRAARTGRGSGNPGVAKNQHFGGAGSSQKGNSAKKAQNDLQTEKQEAALPEMKQRNEPAEIQATQLIAGVHTVRTLLNRSAFSVVELWVEPQRRDQRINEIVALAEKSGIRVTQAAREQLDHLLPGINHQGVAARTALASVQGESALENLLTALEEPPLLLVLDGVQDPHNLGACLRSADGAGVHAVIAPKDRSVGLTPVVCKVASGAAESVPFIQVTNLARTLARLKRDYGLWLVGTAGESSNTLYEASLTGPLALVMGGEGKGLRRLTREACDYLVRLPMLGAVESLNVSVATGICLYEALRQRGMPK